VPQHLFAPCFPAGCCVASCRTPAASCPLNALPAFKSRRPWLLFAYAFPYASCFLTGCCIDNFASCPLESASLLSLAPPLLSPPLLTPRPLLASSNALRTLLARGSHSPTGPPALPHLIHPSCLLPCLLPRRRLLWCVKTAQSTHSHWQHCKRVSQMVLGGQYGSLIRDGGSGSLSGTHVWTIFVNPHHCRSFLLFFWLVEATAMGGRHQSKIALVSTLPRG
jgi:hypothetical protein